MSLNQVSIQQNSLLDYMNKINKFPILTPEEEYKYAKMKDAGNLDAAKMLITSHLRLVVKIAAKYRNYGLPLSDVIAEGNIGLMRAVKGFDPEKGFKLATYAMWWIRATIQEYILKSWSLVKIGTTAAQKKLFFNLNKIKNKILSSTNRKVLNPQEISQIAHELSVTKDEVTELDQRLNCSDISLHKKIQNQEGETELIELIAADQPNQEIIVAEKREKETRQKILLQALSTLNDREKDIIQKRRLSENSTTLEKLSQKYKISRERIRQIEARALEKMKVFFSQNQ